MCQPLAVAAAAKPQHPLCKVSSCWKRLPALQLWSMNTHFDHLPTVYHVHENSALFTCEMKYLGMSD